MQTLHKYVFSFVPMRNSINIIVFIRSYAERYTNSCFRWFFRCEACSFTPVASTLSDNPIWDLREPQRGKGTFMYVFLSFCGVFLRFGVDVCPLLVFVCVCV